MYKAVQVNAGGLNVAGEFHVENILHRLQSLDAIQGF
jgi:hypothetical protein